MMQAITRHNLSFATKNKNRVFLDIHQFKDSELSFFIVKEKVDIGIVFRFAARG